MSDSQETIELSLFSSRVDAICAEMGAVLQRAAFSPNIKERLDFSCALFDAQGALGAQAAHIPVHLGSMAYAMGDLVKSKQWEDGDMVVVNDPFLGGTHLPDVTLIAPCFVQNCLIGFVANRAHHADIGAQSPGSMPFSTNLEQEGMVLAPRYLLRKGELEQSVMASIEQATQQPWQTRGDFSAQISANKVGLTRLKHLVEALSIVVYERRLMALNDYARRMCRSTLAGLQPGVYNYQDMMDDDGWGSLDIVIQLQMQVEPDKVVLDFSGTADQVRGNINCPLSVAAAAVYYVFRCLMPPQTPACAGSLEPIEVIAPGGCLLNARRPAAVAAGNVETSSRVVDVVMGALSLAMPDRLPAASQGSMNNLAMGGRDGMAWDYYETIGGGMGAGPLQHGLSAVQTHLTNTRNTPIEDLEMNYPLRINRYEIRRGSGGQGQNRGGDGIIREYQFLSAAQLTLLTERRRHPPWGMNGGGCGATGENRLNGRTLPGKTAVSVTPGDILTILTPGGGGWGT